MTRKRKKKNQPTGIKRGPNRDGQREIARYWSAMIRKGLKVRQEYTNAAKAVEQYLGPVHKELFERDDVRTHFMKMDGSSAVSVPKMAQMRNTLGPRLYQTKPVRSLHALTRDPIMAALGITLELYTNYTVREAKVAKQLRKSIDDGLIRGRAFLRQEFDVVREIVTSKYLSSLDVVFDPDFIELEEGKWIAYRMVEPLWETKRRITEKWRIKGLDGIYKNIETDDHSAGKSEQIDGADRKPSSTELTTYWVVLSKMGKGYRGLGVEAGRRNDDQDFVRLEVVLDHEFPISVGDWDVPLFLDKEFPVSYCDYVEPIDKHWPDSTGSQVLPSQQAIDLLSSVRLQSCKNRDRLMVFADASVMSKTNTHAFKNGGAAEFISVQLPSGKQLNDSILVPDFGEGSTFATSERMYHESQIEQTTGVTDALTGGAPAGGVDRSATASKIRSDASNMRIMDLRNKTQELTNDAARKEAIITRLMLDPEDVSPVVPIDEIGMFYIRIEVPGGAHVPVRDTRPTEEREADPAGPVLTLEQIDPMASTFFIDPNIANGAAMDMWEGMQQTDDQRVAELTAMLSTFGQPDPMTGLPGAISVEPVDVEIVWEATAGMTPRELMREYSHEVVAGTGHNVDKAAEQQNADHLMQNVLPVVLQGGDINTANAILDIRNNAYDVPLDQRVQIEPPPPPPAMGPGGEQLAPGQPAPGVAPM